MSEKLDAVLPKIALLLRRLTSSADNEVISAAHLLLRVLAGVGLDIYALVERIENPPPLSAGEMQKIWDAGYTKGHADGAEQGRHSAVIAAAQPIGIFAPSDVGTGVNGYSWFDIAQYCACSKHRIAKDKDRVFVESIAEQLTTRHSVPTPKQAKWLCDLFMREFNGKI